MTDATQPPQESPRERPPSAPPVAPVYGDDAGADSGGLAVHVPHQPLISDQGPASEQRPGRARTERGTAIAWPPPPPAPDPPRTRRLLHIALLLLLAAAPRTIDLGGASFWGDEALCWLNAAAEPAQTIEVLAAQNQPPGYHLLLRAWMSLAGRSDAAARALSALAGLAALLLLYRLGRHLFDHRTALVAMALGSTSTFWIMFSREATMYTVTLALGLAGSWQFLRTATLTERDGARRHAGSWLLLGLLHALLLYVHYFGVFLIAGEAVVAAYLASRSRRPKLLAAWGAALLVTAALFAPWAPVFVEQVTRVGEAFWTQGLSLGRVVNVFRQWLLYLPEADHGPWIPVFALPATGFLIAFVGLARLWLPGAALSGLAATSRLAGRWLGRGRGAAREVEPTPRQPEHEALNVVAIYLLVPLALCLLSSLLGRPLFEPKYQIIGSGFFYLALAVGLTRSWRPIGRRLHGAASRTRLWLGLGLIVAGNLIGTGLLLWHPGYANPDFRSAAEAILQDWQSGDLVLTVHPEGLASIGRYLNAGNERRPLYLYWESGRPPFYEGLGMFGDVTFCGDLEYLAARQRRIWVPIWSFADRPWEDRQFDEQSRLSLLYFLAGTFGLSAPPPPLVLPRLELYRFPVERSFDVDAILRRRAEAARHPG